MISRLALSSALIGLASLAAPAFAQQTPAAPPADHPGRATYVARCATCHDDPVDARAATFASLRQRAPAQLRDVLTTGVMAPMAAGLAAADLNNLIGYLTYGQAAAPASWTEAAMCAPDKRGVNVKGFAATGFGGDLAGSRNLTAKQAGLKKADMKNLEVAWTIGFPTAGYGTGATVVGDTMYVTGGQKTLALDPASGCIKWTFDGQTRNTPAFGTIDGKPVLAFSMGRDIQVLDAVTGQSVWKANGQPTDNNGSIRGGVVIHKDKVIVPISASGVAAGGNATFECCVGHGAVVALSLKDGAKLWEYHTMPTATYTGAVNSRGAKQRGPSGAPIWSVPTIDEKRNRVIVTTGENTSHPATDTSDAVIALNLDTGKQEWLFQAMALDVWNMACSATPQTSGPNCPWNIQGDTGVGRDFDFGAQAIVAKGAGGKDVILAGQKSGHVWALDAQTGKKLWEQQVGQGTALGGVHWDISTDGARVFAAINDPIPGGPNSKPNPGMYAFDIKTGKRVWGHDAKPNCEGARGTAVAACTSKYGFSAAPLTVDGALIGATLGGEVFVFDSKTGKILKQIDTIGEHKSINGVAAKGGSIDAHGISAGGGAIIINSGYGSFGQTTGNALIALKPKK